MPEEIKEEGITPLDIWDFIQKHKDETKEEFGSWILGQHYRTTDKIMKAITEYNEKKKRK